MSEELTLTPLSKLLGIPKGTLASWARSGRIHRTTNGGFNVSEVRKAIEARDKHHREKAVVKRVQSQPSSRYAISRADLAALLGITDRAIKGWQYEQVLDCALKRDSGGFGVLYDCEDVLWVVKRYSLVSDSALAALEAEIAKRKDTD